VDLSNLTTATASGAFNETFKGCTSLKTVYLKKLSRSSSSVLANTFNGCTALELVDFSEATAVPAINSNTFSNTNSTFKIVVPDSKYNSWIAATNWSSLSAQIMKVSDYQASLQQA